VNAYEIRKSNLLFQHEIDRSFLITALSLSKTSTCVSKKVCALIVKNNTIISYGINGTLPGAKCCSEIFDENNFDREEHHKWSLYNELHAEALAFSYCVKAGIGVEGATLYCTLKPCDFCANSIVASGIKRVVFYKDYDKCVRTDEIFNLGGIEVKKIDDLEKEI